MDDIKKQLLVAKGTAIAKSFSEKPISRTTFSPEDIKQVTDMCQLTTAAAGARQWNTLHPDRPIHENTVLKYVNYFKEHKTYYIPETRGPKHLLNSEQEEILVAVLKQWRANGNAIISTLVSSIAAGLFSPYNNGREKVNGLFEFSSTWARDFMDRKGFRVRKATTDRTVDAATVVAEGKTFYEQLKKLQKDDIPPELCFNFDEFFACFGENNRWTWERVSVGEKRNIVIRTETHVFQPCDQFVIAGLKQLSRKMWYNAITEAYKAEGSVEEITNQVLSSRTKFRRKNKLEALIKAAEAIPSAQIRKSWFASGVLRALYNIEDPKTPVVYDAYKEEHEGGKVVIVEESDEDEEEVVEEVEAERPTKAARVEVAINLSDSLVKAGWAIHWSTRASSTNNDHCQARSAT